MKIFPISDIHPGLWHPTQKYWRLNFGFLDDIDVMVIAGDGGEPITNIVLLTQILLEFPKLEIVYVPGNHDFYGMNMDQALEAYVWADYSLERLHLLSGYQYSTWEYNNVVFIGGTLWTDFCKGKPYIMNEVQKGLNDYKAIMSGKDRKPITTNRILNEHNTQKKFIFKYLNKYKDKIKVVVTHHKPYLRDCITEGITYGYEVDMTDEFNACESLPEIWISGHTHMSEWKEKQFEHGSVLFVSNQFGYPNEDPAKTGFHKDCILEL